MLHKKEGTMIFLLKQQREEDLLLQVTLHLPKVVEAREVASINEEEGPLLHHQVHPLQFLKKKTLIEYGQAPLQEDQRGTKGPIMLGRGLTS